MAETTIVKDARSLEHLVDKAALFLHRVASDLQERTPRPPSNGPQSDPDLAGRKVLIVDDDVRNIFALTTVLEGRKMQVSYAESGKDCLKILQEKPDTEIILMDVMMPEMDGYQTMQAIRNQE